VTTKRSLVVQF